MFIYKITNKINGKSYVGYTKLAIIERWKQHCEEARSGNGFHLHRAIRKYGKKNFTIEQVCRYKNPEHTKRLETFFIRKFDSYCNGYNMTEEGGQGGKLVENFRHTEGVKRKMSKDMMGNEHGAGNKGKKHSREAKRKMSNAKVGKVSWNIGREHSEETKKKISKSLEGHKRNLGKKHTEETKKKMSEKAKGRVSSMKGKKLSKETKRKMSKSHKERLKK